MPRILVVEDNPDLAFGLCNNLEIEGYEIAHAANGRSALDLAESFDPHLIILDLGIPEPDGFRVLKTIRDAGNDVPVMILSAAGEETNKVRGLRIGADDFVTKPFSILELLARVEALLRRSRERAEQVATDPDADVERFGNVMVDLTARSVRAGDRVIDLTPREFDLLAALLRHRGKNVSRGDLMREAWGHRAEILSRTVDTHVSELRHKLEPDPANPRHIITVWKMGYRLQG